ncbi:MAG TPA: site-specific integrase [Polyangiaceae bacterium]|nr:site-specific integrase [Polyangiaceae bacterium]
MSKRLRQKKEGWGARIRFGEGLARDEWIHLDLPNGDEHEPLAQDRLARLQAMGKRLSDLGKHAEARPILEEAGATRHERGFAAIEKMVAEMAAERVPQRAPKTFRKVVQELCDGTLHELYPDEIGDRTKEGQDARRSQLAVFFPVLGDKTFDQITRDDIDQAKLRIPKEVKQNTRITYCRELRYVMQLAVEPLRLVEHVAHVSVPRQTPTDLFQLFYPDEEEQLAASEHVTFEERFLTAFLCRNGGRVSETLQYTWEACDLERGTMHVAAAWTKTKRARSWDLEPDVLEALRLRRLQIPDADIIFVPPPGRVFNRFTVHHQLHPNLRAAGVPARPGLYEAPEGERPLTPHDLRGSMVTFARAIGMPDVWIRDRTGHESPKMLERYDRGVRHARKRGTGWWAPMASILGMPGARVRTRLGEDPSGARGLESEGMPGVASARRLGPMSGPISVQSWAKEEESSMIPHSRTKRVNLEEDSRGDVNPRNSTTGPASFGPSGSFGPSHFSTLGQSSLSSDQLTRLLTLAERAKQWDLVAALGLQLDAAQKAEAPNVSSLVAARARRDRGER